MPRAMRLSYARYTWLCARMQVEGNATRTRTIEFQRVDVQNYAQRLAAQPLPDVRAHNGTIGETASGRGGR